MRYAISGGKPLKGTLFVQGAKNAVLPMIAAALLVKKGQTVLRNVPPLNDVFISIKLAESIGAKVTYYASERVLVIDASELKQHILDSSLTTQSRASILFLPVVLHRLGKIEFRGVGGCALGARSLDFHFNGFKRLGARVEGEHDQLIMKAEQLKGNLVYLDVPSQTSTENLMMAGCVAQGETIIENAGSEPEIVDFASFLSKMGAKLRGVGTRTIYIEGVKEPKACEYTVMCDRLDAGPFMMAAAVTGGDVAFIGAELEHMRLLVVKLQQMGVEIEANGKLVRVKGPKRLKPVNIITTPYPGFSTDFLPGFMAIAAVADGISPFRETVFADRFTQADGLNSLGANIEKKGPDYALVTGVDMLQGGFVTAPDLRAGMSFVIAGLIANGETIIDNVYQIERGHSDLDIRLQGLGASIKKIVS